jgi:hypothetical protein
MSCLHHHARPGIILPLDRRRDDRRRGDREVGLSAKLESVCGLMEIGRHEILKLRHGAVLRLRIEEEQMLKALCAALVALSLICCTRADAQTAPDPDTIAAARELLTTMRLADQFKQLLPRLAQTMKPAILAGRPEMEKDFDVVMAVLVEGMNARVGELLDQIAGIYGQNFTASELRQAAAFYRTPVGQKILDKQPAMMQETMTMGQNFGRAVAADLQQRLIEELRKRGHQL